MKKLDIMNKLSRTYGKVGLQLKKHSPEILIAAGVVGTVTSAVMACKATMKLNDILEESKSDLDKIHDYVEENGFTEKYTEQDSKKDLTLVYTQSAFKIAKLYAPSVVLGALSITGIVASNQILRKRNIAIAAAYTAIDKSFKEYRGRVVERFGNELDYELRHGIKAKEIETIEVNEDGTESVVKKTVNAVDPNTIGDYARVFDCGNPGWEKDPQLTMTFLKNQQRYADQKLKAQGYLFLNEVYDMLGYAKVPAGQVVGWIYDEKNPNGDNFVDFGLYNLDNERTIAFVNGDERSILLDFNVDGVIYNMI